VDPDQQTFRRWLPQRDYSGEALSSTRREGIASWSSGLKATACGSFSAMIRQIATLYFAKNLTARLAD
jgi:hypothetical protein